MRKESSNQFTEGLVCDLNPINTPNTILTDALNATIITYDGNEFSLQNDRGNYPLENCRLKPNYIPVGLKEYGDILYIVSYNPLDNHVEIGTYPSPMEVETSNLNDTTLDLQSVIETIVGSTEYSKLVEGLQTKVWTSDDEEDSKLYPGDEYKINVTSPSTFKYETLEYYVIDENRQKYNISDLVEADGNWHTVAWQIPGWLASQYRIGTFDDFIMSLRSIEAPSIGTNNQITCKMSLNFQFRISDRLFLPINNNEDEIKSDLGIMLKISNSKKTLLDKEFSIARGGFLDWYSDSKILWIDDVDNVTTNLGDTLYITATPFVEIVTDGVSRRIIYDSFVESRSVFLNAVGDYSDFKIGESLWKFYIDDAETNQLYLEYDVTGPYVTKSQIKLFYRVWDIDCNTLIQDWDLVKNYTGITNQGVGILDFTQDFRKEAIYVLEFAFHESEDKEVLNTSPSTKKLIIASEIFSNFVGEYTNFNEITFDKWISKYKDSIKASDWKTEGVDVRNIKDFSNFTIQNGKLLIDNKSFENKDLDNLWNVNYKGDDKGIFSLDDWNNLKDTSTLLIKGNQYDIDISISGDINALVGKLWEHTPSININIKSYLSNETVNKHRNKLSEVIQIPDFTTLSGKTLNITYDNISTLKRVFGIKQINEVPVVHVHFEGWDTYANDKITVKYADLGNLPNTLAYPTNILTWETTNGKYHSISSNPISKFIQNSLGNNDMGVLFTTFCMAENFAGQMQFRYGKDVVWSDNNGSNTWLYAYLVFKKANTNTGAAIIPITRIPKTYVGKGNVPKLDLNSSAVNSARALVNELKNGINICTKNNAVDTGYILNIKTGNIQETPLCEVNISAPSFNTWFYESGSGKYDLLSNTSRDFLIKRLTKEVCGNLLTGVTKKIDNIEFGSMTIDNVSESQNQEFREIEQNIIINNNNVATESPSKDLVNQINNPNTKGVYWLGNSKPEELIESLHSNYSASDTTQLIWDSSYLSDANVYLTNDKEGLIFAYVDTETTVE